MKLKYALKGIVLSCLILGCISTGFSYPSESSSETGVMEGFVYSGANGKPMVGTSIHLNGINLDTLSTADGYYHISGIEPGIYTATAGHGGMLSITIDSIQIFAGDTTLVDFGSLDSTLNYGYNGIIEFPITGESVECDFTKTNQYLYSIETSDSVLTHVFCGISKLDNVVRVDIGNGNYPMVFTGLIESVSDSTFYFTVKPHHPLLFSLEEVYDHLVYDLVPDRILDVDFSFYSDEPCFLPESMVLISREHFQGWIGYSRVSLNELCVAPRPNLPEARHRYLEVRSARNVGTLADLDPFNEHIVIETNIVVDKYSYNYLYNLFAHVIYDGPLNCRVFLLEGSRLEPRLVGECMISESHD